MQDIDECVDVINGERFLRYDHVGCPLCGKKYGAKRIPIAFGMHVMVAECLDCQVAYQTPRPTPEASLAYMNWRWTSDDEYVGDKASQMARARKQVDIVKQYVGKPAKLADFGAGAGSFVRAALDLGWDVSGVELSDTARERAKEFYNVNLLKDFEGTYDVVTMWDVVEHLRDPIGTLDTIREHLSDNGLLFVETGNFANWSRIADNENWGLYLFDHQYYFTPPSLFEALHRAGYEECRLLDYNHRHPPISPISIIRRPLYSISSWKEWIKAKRKWAEYGDINVMILVGKK